MSVDPNAPTLEQVEDARVLGLERLRAEVAAVRAHVALDEARVKRTEAWTFVLSVAGFGLLSAVILGTAVAAVAAALAL